MTCSHLYERFHNTSCKISLYIYNKKGKNYFKTPPPDPTINLSKAQKQVYIHKHFRFRHIYDSFITSHNNSESYYFMLTKPNPEKQIGVVCIHTENEKICDKFKRSCKMSKFYSGTSHFQNKFVFHLPRYTNDT